MKQMKRFLAVLLAMCMTFGSMNYSVLATSGTEINSESEDSESAQQSDTEEASAQSAEILTDETEVTAKTVGASAPEVYTDSYTYINPLYEDVIDESDLAQPSGIATVADVEYATSVSAAAAIVRAGMVNRQATIEFVYQTADGYDSSLSQTIVEEAAEHTGVSTEGDYLKWQYAGWYVSVSYYSSSGVYYITYTYTMTYYTTAEQEATVTSTLAEVEDSLGLDSLSDYEKVCAIYDYICAHVTYDYDNLNDSTYTLKYTAYAALINGTSVCQGYAVLFYRMALDAGLDARFISGTSNNEGHGWNIVKLGIITTTWMPPGMLRFMFQEAIIVIS